MTGVAWLKAREAIDGTTRESGVDVGWQHDDGAGPRDKLVVPNKLVINLYRHKLLSLKWWDHKNVWHNFYRFWYLLSNDAIVNAILHDLDPLFQGQIFQMLTSWKWWELAKKCITRLYSFWYLPLNGAIPKVVILCDLFQGQTFQILISWKQWERRKNAKYNFYRLWNLSSNGTIASVILCDPHQLFQDQNCKLSISHYNRFALHDTNRRTALGFGVGLQIEMEFWHG